MSIYPPLDLQTPPSTVYLIQSLYVGPTSKTTYVPPPLDQASLRQKGTWTDLGSTPYPTPARGVGLEGARYAALTHKRKYYPGKMAP